MSIVINYWAVLFAGVIAMAFGALWYSPLLFGNLWAKFSGLDMSNIDSQKKKGMAKTYLLHFIFILIGAYVFAHLIALQNITTVLEGMTLGFWAWLGFQVPIMIGSVLWEKRPINLFILNATHNLVALWLLSVTIVLLG